MNVKHELPLENTVVTVGKPVPTMSSLEMVDYINAERKAKAEAEGMTFPCKKYRTLRHDSFMAKVPKVLGEEVAPKFFGTTTYINGGGGEQVQGIYNFPKREACLMAMSYSWDLQAQVFDRMSELEGKKDVNPLDFSGLLEMTTREMQDHIARAEKHSKAEASDGSKKLNTRKKEIKAIKKAEQLVKELIQFRICDMGDFPEGEEVES